MAQKPAKVDVVIANHPSFVVDADVESVDVPVAFLKGDQDVSLVPLLNPSTDLVEADAESHTSRGHASRMTDQIGHVHGRRPERVR